MTSQPRTIESARLRQNRLLARLDSDGFARITAQARIVTLRVGEIIHAPHTPVEQVFFPLTGTVSLVGLAAEGTMVEAATIGNEGTTGVPVFLAGDLGPLQVIAQVGGDAAVVPVAAFRSELRDGSSLQDTMRRYTQAQMVQTAQTALCNRLHELEERAARWLLQTQDRVAKDQFGLTHEFLSVMLGVRRPTVSVTVGILHQAGLVSATRGHIQVLDRQALEEATCECYAVIRDEYERRLAPSLGQAADRHRTNAAVR